MLNNEFRLIGVVTENFVEVGSEKFSRKRLKLEVERKGKIRSSTYPVIVLGTNGVISTEKNYVGQTVIINGYVDVYKDYVSLVAQDLYIVGVGGIVDNNLLPQDDKKNAKEEPIISEEDLPFW